MNEPSHMRTYLRLLSGRNVMNSNIFKTPFLSIFRVAVTGACLSRNLKIVLCDAFCFQLLIFLNLNSQFCVTGLSV